METTQKPLVFMSHATGDQVFLARLRDLLIESTGGSIDFFLSTIPLGTKWSSEIVNALKKTQLVLCFVSPTALNSQWLFFEAGYAHALGAARLVPVAMFGVRNATLSPPLGDFQGLTLENAAGVHQLIEIFNDRFGHTHRSDIDDEAYAELIASSQHTVEIPPGRYRLYDDSARGEEPHEELNLTIEGDRIVVRGTSWESIGFLADNRYVGRFKYFSGATADHVGTHDLAWDGSAFRGSYRFDNGKWEASNLVWRPEQKS